MKIVKLQAENVKRLVAVEIEPDGALVQITGRNGAGKSSVLDAIWWALAGKESHQAAPIRQGENVATITLDMGEVVVTREFARREDNTITTRIRVETADGARFPSPQKMLDGLLGSLTFDPLAFTRASDREQVEMLSGLCGVDMEAVERENKADYDRRRDYNRKAKDARAAAGRIDVPADTPDEPVSVADIVGRIREAEAKNREREGERAERERAEAHIADLMQRSREAGERGINLMERGEQEIRDLESRIEAVRRRMDRDCQRENEAAARYANEADKLRAKEAKLPPVTPDIDTSAMQAQIETAEHVNADVAERDRKDALIVEAIDAEHAAEKLTAAINARRRKARDAIAAADLPVEGLSVANGRVMLGDLPLEVASDAERLRVSCAIAMRGDAKLRVLRVRDGSLLDPDSLRLLGEMAETMGWQVWIEMVDTSGKVGIVIEAGEVAS